MFIGKYTCVSRLLNRAAGWLQTLSLALVAAAVPYVSYAQSCLPISVGSTGSNVANHGSPFLYWASNAPVMIYRNHADNVIYSSYNNAQSVSTGIATTPYGMDDVTGAQLQNGNHVIDWIGNNINGVQTVYLAQSANGYNSFGSPYAMTIPGGSAFNLNFVPYLYSFGNYVYAAYVAGTQPPLVYLARSTDGQNWTQLGVVSQSFGTSSRPTLASFNGNLYVQYVGAGTRYLYNGTVIVNGAFVPGVVSNQNGTFSNSHYNNSYAGVAVQQIGSTFWAFAQGVGSGNQLWEATSADGTNFNAPFPCTLNFRFTPSVLLDSSGVLHVAWQNNDNTNISTGTD